MDSYFGKGVRLKGTLRVKGTVHFDGDFEGEIYSIDHFIVGKSGKVLGNIKTRDVTNNGFIQGNLFAENIANLLSGSRLTGDISTYHLKIDEGAIFEGCSAMVDAPPDIIKEKMGTHPSPKKNHSYLAKLAKRMGNSAKGEKP